MSKLLDRALKGNHIAWLLVLLWGLPNVMPVKVLSVLPEPGAVGQAGGKLVKVRSTAYLRGACEATSRMPLRASDAHHEAIIRLATICSPQR